MLHNVFKLEANIRVLFLFNLRSWSLSRSTRMLATNQGSIWDVRNVYAKHQHCNGAKMSEMCI